MHTRFLAEEMGKGLKNIQVLGNVCCARTLHQQSIRTLAAHSSRNFRPQFKL
jgi:hypothetical protein